MHPPENAPNDRPDFFAKKSVQDALLALVFLALAFAFAACRPGKIYNSIFLDADNGLHLSMMDQLLAGKTLYRDTFNPYGPIPVCYGLLFARLFGNTPPVFVLSMAVAYAFSFWVGIKALRAHCRSRGAVLLGIVTLGCILWRSWASCSRIYLPFEVALFYSVALLWKTPDQRGWSYYCRIGLLLGLSQWVKFGGAVIGLGALVVADFAWLLVACPSGAGLMGRVRQVILNFVAWWPLAATLAACEILRAACLYLWLPFPVFKDAFFPAFMVEHYKAYVDPEWSSWAAWSFVDLGVFFNYQLPTFVALVISIRGLAVLIKNRLQGDRAIFSAGAGAALFLFCFYVLGFFFYFKHKWIVYQYVWLLALPLAVFVERLSRWLFAVVILSLSILIVSVPGKFLPEHRGATLKTIFPDGQCLYLTPGENALWQNLHAALARLPDSGHRVVFLQRSIAGYGTGLYHFAGIQNPTRHNWYLPKWVRPYEEKEVLGQILSCDGIIFHNFKNPPRDYTTPDGWQDFRWSPLGASMNEAIKDHFVLQETIGNEWILLRPKSSPSSL